MTNITNFEKCDAPRGVVEWYWMRLFEEGGGGGKVEIANSKLGEQLVTETNPTNSNTMC